MAEMCAVKIRNCVPWSLVLSIALSGKSTVKLTMVASIPATNATRTRSPIAPWLETPTRRHTGDLAGPEASASLLPSRGRAHCPLMASYLHRIGWQQSPVCPYCGGDDETAQHLLLCCPSHASARTSTNYINSTDPRRMWSFLGSIGAVTRPLPRPGMRQREHSLIQRPQMFL